MSNDEILAGSLDAGVEVLDLHEFRHVILKNNHNLEVEVECCWAGVLENGKIGIVILANGHYF